jgi:molybdenum cofactor cytidylyltransferase
MNTLAVVILAAGASTRMRQPKLLLPWRETSVVGHLISQWRELVARQITLVIRPSDAALEAELDRLNFPRTARITNPQAELGMFSSIRCAARWRGWAKEISHVAIALGDQPHLQPGTLRELMTVAASRPDAICQPCFAGSAGHPVILPRHVFQALATTTSATLKDFLKLSTCARVQHVINDPGLTLDLDTPEDYVQARGLIRT